MNKTEISKEIKSMVEQELNMQVVEEEELLFGVAGGFDSLSLLNFILKLESKYNVIIPDDDLVPENFATIESIAVYIMTLLDDIH